MKILGQSKNLNMNKTEFSLNISLICYYVVFLVSLLTALGMLHCHHVKLDIINEGCSDQKYHAAPV